jgi:hypothetical protein
MRGQPHRPCRRVATHASPSPLPGRAARLGPEPSRMGSRVRWLPRGLPPGRQRMARWRWFWAAAAQTMARRPPAVAFSTSPKGRPNAYQSPPVPGNRPREPRDAESPQGSPESPAFSVSGRRPLLPSFGRWPSPPKSILNDRTQPLGCRKRRPVAVHSNVGRADGSVERDRKDIRWQHKQKPHWNKASSGCLSVWT